MAIASSITATSAIAVCTSRGARLDCVVGAAAACRCYAEFARIWLLRTKLFGHWAGARRLAESGATTTAAWLRRGARLWLR
jgi:hypothetical protein